MSDATNIALEEGFAEQLPHAVIIGNCLRGLGMRRFHEIHASLVAQGIEPPFLRDPRVVRAALDDLVRARIVAHWPVVQGVGSAPPVQGADDRYQLINDPTAGR